MALHDGHRQRMYQKLEQGGVLAEHEWLEILLFTALPRRNTNDIAHRLLNKFGSADRIFLAPMELLLEVEGVGPSVAAQIRAIGHFFVQYCHEKDVSFCGEYDHLAFTSYVKCAYEGIPVEVADLYLLDGEGNVAKRRRFTLNDRKSVEILPEEYSLILSTEEPAGIVLVHNHPFGGPDPSAADEAMTKKCQMLCSMHNVMFCDHIIYAKNGVYSYYLSGRLKNISKDYAVETMVTDNEGQE